MIAPEHKEEILRFINSKIRKFKRERWVIARAILARKPNVTSLTKEIPQCALDYKLRDIIEFLVNAENEGKILF